MKYTIRYSGEWHTSPWGRAIFRSPWVMEYTNFNDIPIFFKHYFNQMKKQGLYTDEHDLYHYQITYV